MSRFHDVSIGHAHGLSGWLSIVVGAAIVLLSPVAVAQDAGDLPTDAPTAMIAIDPGAPLYIPAVAHVSGAAGTNWRSDVEIFNLGPGQAFIEVELLKKNQPNPTPAKRSLVISPGMGYRYRDVLERMFGASGSAALRITEVDDALVVTSRTFNQTDDGTYGQFIGALDESRSISTGGSGRIIQLSQHVSATSGNRTNLGLLNCNDLEISAHVELFRSDGTLLGTKDFSLGPLMFKQIDRVFSTVTGDDVDDGFAVVSTPTAGGVLIAYGSVVDNRTGDPIYIPAAAAATSERVMIPAAAHVTGAVGTDWRTDVELHNPGTVDALYEIALLETDHANPTPAVSVKQVSAGASVRLEDVLHSVFGFDGTAALRIRSVAGADGVITSRTYNQTPDGTYGQFLGAVPVSESILYGEQGLMSQLTYQQGAGSGYRTNVGYVNCTGTEAEILINLFRANGELLGSVEDTIGPYMHRQRNRIFQRVTTDDVVDGFAVIISTTPESKLMAYASVVDNATGDPIYIPAARTVAREPETTMDPRSTMYLLHRALDEVDLVEMMTLIRTFGLQAALDTLAVYFPTIVTVGPNSFALDYGSSHRLRDGNLVSGRVGAYFADVVIDSTTVSGLPSFTFDDFRWNGQEPPVDTILSTVNLSVDPEGNVAGTTTFTGTGTVPAKSIPSTLYGDVYWNTVLCRRFPVGGTVTLEIGNEEYTFTFDPDCDGDFDYSETTPGWDFTYAFGNPNDMHAQQHIVSTVNAETWQFAPVWFWKPEIGGEEFANTPPGVITFRFDFDQTVAEAHLKLNMPTFHWDYSRGHNFLYGSADGVTWELLMEVEPPEYGLSNAGFYDADLPPSLTGESEFWLRADLYSYGEMAPQGGEYTNTAELTRWDQDNPARSFQLDVRFD